MSALQTSALELYFGLNLLLTFLLVLNEEWHRSAEDSADQIMPEKAVRAHGNNTEYVPIILIGLGVMTMMAASAQTISIFVEAFFVARVFTFMALNKKNLFLERLATS